jgi:hypothetical protein
LSPYQGHEQEANKAWRTNLPKAFQFHFDFLSIAPVGAHLTFGFKMKSLTVLLALIMTLGALQASPLWNGTHTGMSIEEVKMKFPTAISPKDPVELYGKIFEGLRISTVTYLDHDFLVRFYFDKGSLHQVTLELQKKQEHPSMVKLAERVARDLSKRLGEPKLKKETKDVTGARFEAIWNTPEQKVLVLVVSMGPTEALYEPVAFNINYQHEEK